MATPICWCLLRPGAAERVLQGLGFAEQLAGLGSDELADRWACAWRRDRSVVDLHLGFYGIETDPVLAWQILSSRTEWIELLGSPVETLAPAPKALLVVLHCAYHGGRAKRATLDLERALARLDERTWREVAAVARELGAVGDLAAGLTLSDEGRTLAGRLGIADRASSAALLRRTEIADGLARLDAAPEQPQRPACCCASSFLARLFCAGRRHSRAAADAACSPPMRGAGSGLPGADRAPTALSGGRGWSLGTAAEGGIAEVGLREGERVVALRRAVLAAKALTGTGHVRERPEVANHRRLV